MIPEIFDKLDSLTSNSYESCLTGLLQRTWATIAESYCLDYLKNKRMDEDISSSDLVRVELRADEVRSAVYEEMGRWKNTSSSFLLEKWIELTLEEQNKLLVEAFPANQVYGV